MMRFLICSLLVLAPLCGAEKAPAAKSGEPKKANRAQAASPAPGVPAGAVEKSPGNWYYTDAQGKAWIYRQTPFGISRSEANPPAPDADTVRRQQEAGWIYRQTPFGMSRSEANLPAPDPDAVRRQQEADLKFVRAVEDGDMVRFERKGPFGVYKWSKPKTDLNEMERKAWENRQTKADSPKDKQE